MRRLLLSCWSVCTMSLSLSGAGPAALADDAAASEAGIRAAARAYVEAFNAHDADALGKLWTEQAVYVDRGSGERAEGRAAIQADLAAVFARTPAIRLQFDAGTVRLIRPDVAQAEATATVTAPDQAPSVVAVSAIYVKQGDQWLLDSVEEHAVATPETAADALADLEWLIGEWRDESTEAASTSTFRWGADGAFLLRSYSTATPDGETQSGTQVIGWDPRARQIRSWTFNSDGSFGEAIWSRNGGDWLIKSTQTLADGGTAAGAYVVTPIDHDHMTVKLIGHEINGEPQPARAAVSAVRVVAAAPAAEAALEQPALQQSATEQPQTKQPATEQGGDR